MGYRIERAKSGRSMCRSCGTTIPKGTYRFGKPGDQSRWFHLACAAEGAPRSFKPFAAEAEPLLAEVPAGPRPIEVTRNPEAEALLAANPDDPDTRAVFIDFLLSAGDPWGEILALHANGRADEAAKLLGDHADDLMGGIPPRLFEWRSGLLYDALLDARKPGPMRKLLERFCGLRIAFTVRRLRMPIKPDVPLVEAINQAPLPALRQLFVQWSAAIDHLARPGLVQLECFVPRNPPVAPRLFSAESLPGLRSLSLYSNTNPLPVPFLEALLRAPLVRQLDELHLFQGALDTAGAERVLALADRIEHIPTLLLDVPNYQKGLFVKRFGTRVLGD